MNNEMKVDLLAVWDRARNCAEEYEATQKGLHAQHARQHRAELREARAVMVEVIAALEDARDRLSVVIECDNEDHGGASPEDVAAFNRATAALAALDAP